MDHAISPGNIIPIVFCFNDKYFLPAAVAIHSLLRVSSNKYKYEIWILHSDVSDKHKKILSDVASKYSNARIEFLDMGDRFNAEFSSVSNKAYWSKEIFYKCILCSLFPQYERIVVSDVDVLFCQDISAVWERFVKDNTNYLAGCAHLSYVTEDSSRGSYGAWIYRDWSEDEAKKVRICVGFLFQNLKLMRRENLEEKMLEFIKDNVWRLTQPEQQVLNMVCHPGIASYKPNLVVLASNYEEFSHKEDYSHSNYTPELTEEALSHPIQLHFSGGFKPWDALFTSKSLKWWIALLSLKRPLLVCAAVKGVFCKRKWLEFLREKCRLYIRKHSWAHFIYSLYRKIVPVS